MSERRKLVIFITEGKSEENALCSVMKCLFSPDEVIFHVINGDMMTKSNKNMVSLVNMIVQEESRRYGLQRSDIRAVIQITDTDGCFIPDEYVVEDSTAGHIKYSEKCIQTAYPDSIRHRNAKRKKSMLSLVSCSVLKGKIPYSIYYFSRNIEHALYGIDGDVNDSRKTDLAFEFSDRFSYNGNAFIRYLEDEDICPGDDYRSSWDAIQRGRESLSRHSNIIMIARQAMD